MICSRHPNYEAGDEPPTGSGCTTCWDAWDVRNRYRKGKVMENPKFCRDCKHMNNVGLYTIDCWRCTRIPPTENRYVCLISGEEKISANHAYCCLQREMELPDACGKEGKFFEPK